MAKTGTILVATFAIILGLFFGFVGVSFLMASDTFGGGQSESSSFGFGLFEKSSAEAGVPTEPWMGVIFLLVGAGALMFGLRALLVAFEGRSDIG